jgi:hypothetical protein
VNLKDRRALGLKVGSLVVQAEHRFPASGAGSTKRAWVMRQAAKEVPTGDGPSAAFGRWFGRLLLRVAIEVGVAVLDKAGELSVGGKINE